MLGGEMMIMSAVDSTLFSLNETASAIWQAADGSTPLGEIVERVVCTEFDIAPAEALQDAQHSFGNWPGTAPCWSPISLFRRISNDLDAGNGQSGSQVRHLSERPNGRDLPLQRALRALLPGS